MMDPNTTIIVPREGLLPPMYEPQIPADLKPDERVRVVPPSPPWQVRNASDMSALFDGTAPQDQRYWFLEEAYEGKLPYGMVWEGEPTSNRWGRGRGLDLLPDGTIIRFLTAAQTISLPDMWRMLNGLVMSRRLLDTLRSLDPDAIESRSLLIRASDDELVSDNHAMVDVVRNLPAIDIANSIVDYVGGSAGYPSFLAAYVSSRVRDDLDGDIAVFRQKDFANGGGGKLIVSKTARQALECAEPPFSNLKFLACGG